jgi:DNA-binding SARP family transcriptional activator
MNQTLLPNDLPTTAAPGPVALSILGPVCLTVNGKPAPLNGESKAAQLLTSLALAANHCLLRAQLLEQIWPQVDPALAGQSLHSLVYSLNKLTRSQGKGISLVGYHNGYYQLNVAEGVWVDSDYFERLIEQGRGLLTKSQIVAGIDCYRQAVALYRGDICTGTDVQTLLERERFRMRYGELLGELAEFYLSTEVLSEALIYLQRLIAHEPCREDAHRQAMRCYMKLDQRSQALRQYRLCCQTLALEFDAQPEPATVALFEQIRLDPCSFTQADGRAENF